MKKILTLFTFALLFFNSISAYAFFPKAPAGNAPAFNTADLEKQQEMFVKDYIEIVKDLVKAQDLAAQALLTGKAKKQYEKNSKALQGANTDSTMNETIKLSEQNTKIITDNGKKKESLDDAEKELLKQSVREYLSANKKMAGLVIKVSSAAAITAEAITKNPAQAITIKKTLSSIITLSKFLPKFSKMNIETLAILISVLEKNGVDMSKEKEAAQSQGAE